MTEREKKILKMRAKGLSNSDIARQLHVWPESVVQSRHNAARKLELARADLKFFLDLETDSIV